MPTKVSMFGKLPPLAAASLPPPRRPNTLMYSLADTSNDSPFSFSSSSGSQFSIPFGDDNSQTGLGISSRSQTTPQKQFSQYPANSNSSYPTSTFTPFGPPPDISALRERCNLLEQQLTKVTTERDTVKSLFDQLASAVQIPLANPSNLAGLPFYLEKPNEKPPTRNSHPSVQFWRQQDYEEWLDTPEALISSNGKYGFLEDEDGKSLLADTLKAIRKAIRAGWMELVNHNMAPKTWGKASASARQTFHRILERDFPLFKLAENGWKLEYLCTKTYSAWSKHHLDDNGQWKKVIKDEDGADSDSDLKKKRKIPSNSASVPSKKIKGQLLSSPYDANT
ncbi:hypothetical protein EDD15DRAFT_2369106 [Pisolithus albus]|nr:hypothetical protein EDD15DRAFT_2369106 [Pisolithus albus]